MRKKIDNGDDDNSPKRHNSAAKESDIWKWMTAEMFVVPFHCKSIF
jgi:hypothetical protein